MGLSEGRDVTTQQRHGAPRVAPGGDDRCIAQQHAPQRLVPRQRGAAGGVDAGQRLQQGRPGRSAGRRCRLRRCRPTPAAAGRRRHCPAAGGAAANRVARACRALARGAGARTRYRHRPAPLHRSSNVKAGQRLPDRPGAPCEHRARWRGARAQASLARPRRCQALGPLAGHRIRQGDDTRWAAQPAEPKSPRPSGGHDGRITEYATVTATRRAYRPRW